MILDQRSLAAHRDLDQVVDADRERPGGAADDPLAAPPVVDRGPDCADPGPDRAELPGVAERLHHGLGRLGVTARAQEAQHGLIGVAEHAEDPVARAAAVGSTCAA